MILFRPINESEFLLIKKSGFTKFPPRLKQQPIFYPVLDEKYAITIARDWNVPAYGCGYVTKFEVLDDYIKKFEIHNVGLENHNELWITSEELEEFNGNITGKIEIIHEFH